MGCFRFLGKVIGLVLLAVFVIMLPVTLWMFNFQRVAFNPAVYQRVLDNPRVYSEVLPTLLPVMVKDVENEPGAPPEAQRIAEMLAGLDEEGWRRITDLLAPIPWMQKQIQNNIDAAFYWLENPQIVPDVGLDMTNIKGRVQSEEGREVVQIIVNSWPPCDVEQQAQMQRSLDAGPESDIPLPFCKPEGRLLAPLTEDISDLVVFITDEFPDKVPEGKQPGDPLTSAEQTQYLNWKFMIRVVRRVAFLIFLIPAIVLVLIEVFAVRSFKSLWLWYGWSFFLGGLASLLPLFALPVLLWQTFVVLGPEAGVSGLRVILSFANVFSRSFGRPVLIQAVAIIGAGLFLLVLGAIARSPEDKFEIAMPSARPAHSSVEIPPGSDEDTAISDRTRPVQK